MLLVPTRRIDAGRITCRGPGGGSVVRHFVNVADAGILAAMTERVHADAAEFGVDSATT